MDLVPNTSDILFDTLETWGVDTVFGLPGDGINGLMEALRQRRDRIRFVLVRHEEAAAFAATGYAKFTGRLGVCLATTGPGAIHLLNGLYDAKLDGQPVLAITGDTYSDLAGSNYQQEVHTIKLFEDVSRYNIKVNSPEHARLATDLAVRSALGSRTVSHLSLPIDVQTAASRQDRSHKKVPGMTSERPTSGAVRAPKAEIDRAVRILNEGDKVVLFVGAGARGAHREILELAGRLQAPVIKALLGKDVTPDDHPLVLGGAGLLGTRPAEHAIEDCDTIFLIGTGFPYLEYLPGPDQARGIQLDIDATRIGVRYPVEVGMVGDAKATLQELVPQIQPRGASDWLQRLQAERDEWDRLLVDRAERGGRPMRPQVPAHHLDRLLDDDAIITCDSGTITTWAARYLRIRGTQRFSLSGNLASMAPGIPYAIGAQVAHPDRQVVAFIGDGGCLMLGSELSTLAHHDLPVKVVVVNNQSLGMIRWEQMAALGNPQFGVRLPKVDFAKFAEAQGVAAWTTDDPDDVEGILREALEHDGPSLVDCIVDKDEPPYPPTVKLEQALHMAQAVARGQPDGPRLGLHMVRDKVRDLAARVRR